MILFSFEVKEKKMKMQHISFFIISSRKSSHQMLEASLPKSSNYHLFKKFHQNLFFLPFFERKFENI